MFKRDIKLFIADIDDSIKAIEEFTNDIGYEYFVGDRKTYSATLREFIVIGEAIAHIPDDVKERFPDIEWRLIKDFRNFIIHEYFGVDPEIVWDAVRKELPLLKSAVASLRANMNLDL
jgi:uncharacterized protein with HEPN domain